MDLFVVVVYSAGLLVLCGFGLHGLAMLVTYHRLRPSDPTAPDVSDNQLPAVTVQLPMYNELHVASRVVDAACSLDYPADRLQIQVLDDSTDETTSLLRGIVGAHRARGVNVELLHRDHRSGYKAGALRDALATASGELIAIFDADFVPPRDFLRRTVPHLVTDPRCGLVQARWEHLNRDQGLLTRAQALALDAHFTMEQQVRNRADYFMNFNGTAGVWRRSCIESAGGWHTDTLTEDLDLSYRAQLAGWRFLYLNEVTVPAELPAEINALKSQQFRWTKGAIETARKLLTTVWRSDRPLRVKIYATNHLTANLISPFILFVALMNVPMVLARHSDAALSSWSDLLGLTVLAMISAFAFYTFAQRDIRVDWVRGIAVFPVFLAGAMGLAVGNTRAVLEALLGRRSGFERTPKTGVAGGSRSRYRASAWRVETAVELFLGAYFILAIGLSVHFEQYALIPLQLVFLFGFGGIGLLSIRRAGVCLPRISEPVPAPAVE